MSCVINYHKEGPWAVRWYWILTSLHLLPPLTSSGPVKSLFYYVANVATCTIKMKRRGTETCNTLAHLKEREETWKCACSWCLCKSHVLILHTSRVALPVPKLLLLLFFSLWIQWCVRVCVCVCVCVCGCMCVWQSGSSSVPVLWAC